MQPGAHGVVRTNPRYNRVHWPVVVVRCTTSIRAILAIPAQTSWRERIVRSLSCPLVSV